MRKKLYCILLSTKLVKSNNVPSVCKIFPSEGTKNIRGEALVSSQELVRKRENHTNDQVGWCYPIMASLCLYNILIRAFCNHLAVDNISGDLPSFFKLVLQIDFAK